MSSLGNAELNEVYFISGARISIERFRMSRVSLRNLMTSSSFCTVQGIAIASEYAMALCLEMVGSGRVARWSVVIDRIVDGERYGR